MMNWEGFGRPNRGTVAEFAWADGGNHEISQDITCVATEFRTDDLPNIRLERYHSASLLGGA
jgi:hypothetical protein